MLAQSTVFHAVADPTRRAVLDLLSAGERAVNDLLAHFRMTQPALSQHLRILRDAGLVENRRDGRRRLYRLRPAPLREVYDWAAHYQRFWTDRLDRLGAFLDRTAEKPR
jgi:DNA-binding transcriptional ArsR family regulator